MSFAFVVAGFARTNSLMKNGLRHHSGRVRTVSNGMNAPTCNGI